jgi:hypothetical protein
VGEEGVDLPELGLVRELVQLRVRSVLLHGLLLNQVDWDAHEHLRRKVHQIFLRFVPDQT